MTKRRGRGHGHGSRRKNKRTMRRRHSHSHSHSAHLTRNRSRRHRHRHGSRVRRGGMLKAAAEVSSANKFAKLMKAVFDEKQKYDGTLKTMSSRPQGGIAKPVPTFSPAASGRLLPSGASGVSVYSKAPARVNKGHGYEHKMVVPAPLMNLSSNKHSSVAAAAAAAGA
jgi:hypothetical protein